MSTSAKELAPRTKDEIKRYIVECWQNGAPLNITSPRVNGDIFFVYKAAWKELLHETKAAGDEKKLLSLLSYGSQSGVSTAYGNPAATDKAG